MRQISLRCILLVVLFITIPLSKVIAADIGCLSPQDTVIDFYRWYLREIKEQRYPLTSDYNKDRSKLNERVKSSLLNELLEQHLRGETDYDYFTYSQDFF